MRVIYYVMEKFRFDWDGICVSVVYFKFIVVNEGCGKEYVCNFNKLYKVVDDEDVCM